MNLSIPIQIRPQPTDATCGPACLSAVYQYWKVPVDQLPSVDPMPGLPGGGTLAVHLALDALQRDLDAAITTFNLQLFDPTWFHHQGEPYFGAFLCERLELQMRRKRFDSEADQVRLTLSTEAYVRFLQLGGRLRMRPLEEVLITRPLSRRIPILCGLSATYLYNEARERSVPPSCPIDDLSPSSVPDDVGGYPVGHFVVLYGFDAASGEVEIADPMHENPFSDSHHYRASFSTLAAALLLGIVTYDANLLTIAPRDIRS
ncbi:hypothetical protein [Crateriforma conspicua]|uniref:Peptidase C39-like domain-containing protein n=1 Tax=Crateriforma conspicua TaxID=2527996 RepID=A0A5C6FKV4_9PLAN|nr:hypothetical protein [Crateriforma conspicua]TWU62760.1 hypothetical protein V7x_44960 [Crateriforma conspicua]